MSAIQVAQCHNFYQQFGGEDQVYIAETSLLESHGHQVFKYALHNKNIEETHRVLLAGKSIWNRSQYLIFRQIFQKIKPDIVHVHNTLPLISPSIYHAAHSEGISVCQTLHNYRVICPNGLFFRNDIICEDCMGQILAWPGIRHACYRRSRSATTILALANSFHRLLGTWKNIIDIYIVLTEFSKQKFIQAGFSKNKILVKPNFVDTSSYFSGSVLTKKVDGALFVGRLSLGKGVQTTINAWKIVGQNLPLKIVGDGPLKHVVQASASNMHNISWLGQKSIHEVYELMAKADMLIFPSECYEGMPLSIIEAFSQGTPVISSNLGAMAEMIDHGYTGLHFEPGNAQDMAEKIIWANAHPDEMAQMGRNARAEYEAKYTPEKNYHMLMTIYEQAIENHRRRHWKKGKRSGR